VTIVNHLLSCDHIVVGLDVHDKWHALEEAALMVERRYNIDHAPILRALWRREQIGSTGLGNGIAIPHARIAGVNEPIVLLLRTKVPIVFGAPDHKPVSILFVILVPEHANEEHLQILAGASEMLSDESFRLRLSAADGPDTIKRLFGDSLSGNT
jgi:PTS system nitrogen regulatory IIA component